MKPLHRLNTFLLLLLVLPGLLLLDCQAAPKTQAPSPPGMVRAMLAACQGLQEGDAVKLELPSGKSVNATCRNYAGDLLAVPDQLADRLH